MKIFVSYRRKDRQAHAELITRSLKERFGNRNVYQDTSDMPPSADFKRDIEKSIRRSDIEIVVIGPDWLDAWDDAGNRRLDDPHDVLRFEIETALLNDMIIIPVLVDDATMPAAEDLPESIRQLAALQAVTIRLNPDYDFTVKKLIASAIAAMRERREQATKQIYRQSRGLLKRMAIGLVAFAVLAAIVAEFVSLDGNLGGAMRVFGYSFLPGRPTATATSSSTTYVTDWSTWNPTGQWSFTPGQPSSGSQSPLPVLLSDGSVPCCSPTAIGLLDPATIAPQSYTVESTIRVLGKSPSAVPGEVYFGLLVRADTSYNGFLIGVLDDSPNIHPGVTFVSVLGLGSGIQVQKAFPLDSQPHTYRVDVSGYTMTLLIDGNPMFQVVNDAFMQNPQVGLMDSGYQLEIESFAVTIPAVK